MQDLTSQTRNGTQASCIGSMKSKLWDHQENPQNTTLYMGCQRKRDLEGVKKVLIVQYFQISFLLTSSLNKDGSFVD